MFSNDPVHAVAWNPDWASHKVRDLVDAAGVDQHQEVASLHRQQLLAARFDPQNTEPGSAMAAGRRAEALHGPGFRGR